MEKTFGLLEGVYIKKGDKELFLSANEIWHHDDLNLSSWGVWLVHKTSSRIVLDYDPVHTALVKAKTYAPFKRRHVDFDCSNETVLGDTIMYIPVSKRKLDAHDRCIEADIERYPVILAARQSKMFDTVHVLYIYAGSIKTSCFDLAVNFDNKNSLLSANNIFNNTSHFTLNIGIRRKQAFKFLSQWGMGDVSLKVRVAILGDKHNANIDVKRFIDLALFRPDKNELVYKNNVLEEAMVFSLGDKFFLVSKKYGVVIRRINQYEETINLERGTINNVDKMCVFDVDKKSPHNREFKIVAFEELWNSRCRYESIIVTENEWLKSSKAIAGKLKAKLNPCKA